MVEDWEERKRRLRNLMKYSIIAVIAIAAVAVGSYGAYVLLTPPAPPTTGPLAFSAKQTFVVIENADGTFTTSPETWEFDYTPVRGQVSEAKLYLNFTRVDHAGGVEFRGLNCYSRDIKEPRIDEYGIDVGRLDEHNEVGFVNWSFAGEFQAIIVVVGSE